MKKWMYIIFPGLGLALFLALYFPANAHYEASVTARAEAVAAQKSADEQHRLALEKQAHEDSLKRQEQNARDEKAREADRIAKRQKEMDAIQKDTDGFNADIAKYQKQVDELQKQLDALHERKDRLTREDFDLLKQVELARVAQSNSDLEIQRMVEMIATRAGGSSLTVAIEVPEKK
jgi:chromosome segregation ATPase